MKSTRRQFLKKAARTFASGFLAGAWLLNHSEKLRESHSLEQTITEANQKLREFPTDENNIPGLKSIEKHETPGAKYCIVILEQMHYRKIPQEEIMMNIPTEEIMKLNMSKEDMAKAAELIKKYYTKSIERSYTKVNNTQKNIKLALEHLAKTGLTRVHDEGILPEYEADSRKIAQLAYFQVLDELKEDGYLKNKTNSEQFKYIPGAARYLAMRGTLELKASEDPVIYNLAQLTTKFESELKPLILKTKQEAQNIPESSTTAEQKILVNAPTSEEACKQYFNELREDSLLKIVSNRESPLSVAIYGADHNFENNIQKWNKLYPDKKFSYIIAKPYQTKQAA